MRGMYPEETGSKTRIGKGGMEEREKKCRNRRLSAGSKAG